MCAQFLIKAKAKELQDLFGIIPPIDPLDRRVLPHNKSFVVTAEGYKEMNFSLIPSWSKERRPKFATHNARIETLAVKPTWKKPLENNRCLVPLTAFIEPIYEKDLAGHMVNFHAPKYQLLTAAGIYDEWVDVKTGEVIESFAILTQDPIDYVANIGHDRSPLFLAPNSFESWIKPGRRQAEDMVDFLKTESHTPELATSIDRALKPGWEKRR